MSRTDRQAFGDALRQLRDAHGLRTQRDLERYVGGALKRGTIANLEAGNRAPTRSAWRVLDEHFPDEAAVLEPLYKAAREEADLEREEREERRRAVGLVLPVEVIEADVSQVLGGPYTLERYELAYVFRSGRAPSEIFEFRRVRARQRGAADYRLAISQEDSADFVLEPEILFGGTLDRAERTTRDDKTLYVERVIFGRSLKKGETHEFLLRHRVARDPAPNTYILLHQTIPTLAVAVTLDYFQKSRPRRVWRFGPVPDPALAPGAPTAHNSLGLSASGQASAAFEKPEIGAFYGIAWQW